MASSAASTSDATGPADQSTQDKIFRDMQWACAACHAVPPPGVKYQRCASCTGVVSPEAARAGLTRQYYCVKDYRAGHRELCKAREKMIPASPSSRQLDEIAFGQKWINAHQLGIYIVASTAAIMSGFTTVDQLHQQMHFVLLSRDRTKPALQSMRCTHWLANRSQGDADFAVDTSKVNELTNQVLSTSKEIMRETKRRGQAGLLAFAVVLHYDDIISPMPLHWQQADGNGCLKDIAAMIQRDPGYFATTSLAEQLNDYIDHGNAMNIGDRVPAFKRAS